MPDVFASADNTISLTQSVACVNGMITYLGYWKAIDSGKVQYAGPRITAGITTGGGIATNTKVTSPAQYLTWPFSNKSAGTMYGIDDTYTAGSDPNTTQTLPNIYIGPLYGPRAWKGYLGYYNFLTTQISESVSQNLSLTHSAVGVKDTPATLTHSVSLNDSSTAEVIKNLVSSLSVTDGVVAFKEVSKSLTDTLTLTDVSTYGGEGIASDDIILSDAVSIQIDYIRALVDTVVPIQSVTGLKDAVDSGNSTLSLTQNTNVFKEISRSVSDTLSLTDTTTGERVFSINNTISLNHSVGLNWEITKPLLQTLTLTDSTIAVSNRKLVDNTLALAQSVVVRGPIARTVTTTVSLTQAVSYNILTWSIENTLDLTQLAESSIKDLVGITTLALTQSAVRQLNRNIEASASNTLSMSQELLSPSSAPVSNTPTLSDSANFTISPLLTVTQTIGLAQVVSTKGSSYTVSLEDNLVITQIVSRNRDDQSITQSLILTQSAEANKDYHSNLNITQGATVDVVKELSNTLTLTQSVVVNQDKLIDEDSNLTVGQSVQVEVIKAVALPYVGTDGSNYHKEPFCKPKYIYSPQIRPGSTFPPVEPTITIKDYILLQWPFVSPTETVTLRSPEYDNNERHYYERIVRESRGGTLQTFRDSEWPAYKKLSFEILLIKKPEIKTCFDFLELSLGQEIQLTDHFDREWKGVIIPVGDMLTFNSRSRRTFQFDFEGELVT